MDALAYPTLVWVHLLLFVLWLGGDVGVFLLGQHFRKRQVYSLDQRLALLKLLVIVDLAPRVAWALMVPVSLSVLRAGGWWAVPTALLALSWLLAAGWILLVFDMHRNQGSARAARGRAIENALKWLLTAFYLGLGGVSLWTGTPIAPTWLALKALAFGFIFIAAILIDVAFRPVGPLLGRLIAEGSSDATEIPLRRVMDRTRIFVLAVYALLLATSWLGSVKPF
jgi:hypothetical protein